MGAEILGFATVVVSFVAWAYQRHAGKIDAQAPDAHQREVDNELASPDKRKLSDRLSRLFDRTRPPADPQ